MSTPLALATLRDLMLEPNRADDEPDTGLLAVDLASCEDVPDANIARIAAWLEAQQLPVVGANARHPPGNTAQRKLFDAVDVTVATDAEYDRVAEAIRQRPMASSILVQVLRTVPFLPVSHALAVESLAYATLQGGHEFADYLARRTPRKPHPANDESSPVLIDRTGNRLAITLNAPHNRNALSVQMRDALTGAFKLVAMDSSITAVEVSGNGPCFSAGGDLTEFGSSNDVALAHRIRSLRMPAQYLAPHAARYTFRLHGACIGAGIELPAFAARIIARPDAVFRLPEVDMGLIPGAGGCVSITRRIGRQHTAWMAITGEEVDARRALEWGLVDLISED